MKVSKDQEVKSTRNTALVIDDVGNELSVMPPDGFEINLFYRDDGSLQVFAFSNTERTRVIAEFTAGAWSKAFIVGVE